MALTPFSPTVVAAQVLRTLDKALTFASDAAVNRDYENEVTAFGQAIQIGSVADVTVGNYAKDTRFADGETLNGSVQTLTIDQSKYWRFVFDDIDAAQNRPNAVEEAARRSMQKIREGIDQYVAGLMVAAATAASSTIGSVASPIAPDKNTAYDYLVDAGVKLTAADTPWDDRRYAIVTPEFYGLLLKDPRFVTFDASLRNDGVLGSVSGMKILVSTQAPSPASGKKQMIVGHRDATTMALQILKTENNRVDLGFGEAYKGLAVYGAKVVRPSELVVINSTL